MLTGTVTQDALDTQALANSQFNSGSVFKGGFFQNAANQMIGNNPAGISYGVSFGGGPISPPVMGSYATQGTGGIARPAATAPLQGYISTGVNGGTSSGPIINVTQNQSQAQGGTTATKKDPSALINMLMAGMPQMPGPVPMNFNPMNPLQMAQFNGSPVIAQAPGAGPNIVTDGGGPMYAAPQQGQMDNGVPQPAPQRMMQGGGAYNDLGAPPAYSDLNKQEYINFFDPNTGETKQVPVPTPGGYRQGLVQQQAGYNAQQQDLYPRATQPVNTAAFGQNAHEVIARRLGLKLDKDGNLKGVGRPALQAVLQREEARAIAQEQQRQQGNRSAAAGMYGHVGSRLNNVESHIDSDIGRQDTRTNQFISQWYKDRDAIRDAVRNWDNPDDPIKTACVQLAARAGELGLIPAGTDPGQFAKDIYSDEDRGKYEETRGRRLRNNLAEQVMQSKIDIAKYQAMRGQFMNSLQDLQRQKLAGAVEGQGLLNTLRGMMTGKINAPPNSYIGAQIAALGARASAENRNQIWSAFSMAKQLKEFELKALSAQVNLNMFANQEQQDALGDIAGFAGNLARQGQGALNAGATPMQSLQGGAKAVTGLRYADLGNASKDLLPAAVKAFYPNANSKSNPLTEAQKQDVLSNMRNMYHMAGWREGRDPAAYKEKVKGLIDNMAGGQ